MGFVNSNSFKHLRGRVGDFIYKHYGDRVVVTRVPRTSGKRSPKQKASEGRFKRGSNYAEKARKDPELWAIYAKQAKKRKTPVRAVAIRDYLTQPDVTGASFQLYTGQPGETVSFASLPPWKVVAAEVELRDAAGHAIERGLASFTNGAWRYLVTKEAPREGPITIVITAIDRFGKRRTKAYAGKRRHWRLQEIPI